jgi:hypothetical protein
MSVAKTLVESAMAIRLDLMRAVFVEPTPPARKPTAIKVQARKTGSTIQPSQTLSENL